MKNTNRVSIAAALFTIALVATPQSAHAEDGVAAESASETTEVIATGDEAVAEPVSETPVDAVDAPAPDVSTEYVEYEGDNIAEKSGAIGIGGGTTLGGTRGALLQGEFNQDWGIQLALGVSTRKTETVTKVEGSDDIKSENGVSGVGVGVYAATTLVQHPDGRFRLLFGADVIKNGTSARFGGPKTTTDSTDLAIATGFQIELFLHEMLSLFAQMGASYEILGEAGTNQAFFISSPGGEPSMTRARIGPAQMSSVFGFIWWL